MENGFNIKEYFNYYITHTSNVLLAWVDIRDVLFENGIINEEEEKKINHLIIWHDNSKIDPLEFYAYGMKFFGNNKTEETDKLFKEAWEHHKKNNLHHHQSLKEYQGTDKKLYVIEMVCDWLAMGFEGVSLASEYFNQIKDKLEIEEEYINLIENIFNLIKTNNCYSANKVTEKEKMLIFNSI